MNKGLNVTLTKKIKVVFGIGAAVFLTIALVAAVNSFANDPTLVAHWAFEEGVGVTATDSSAQGNHGTLINNPTWVTGQVGGALSFDGVDDYVLVSNSSSLDVTHFTVTFWIQSPSVPGTSKISQPIDKRSNGSSSNFVFSWDHTNVAFRQSIAFRDTGNGWQKTKIASTLSANTWYHIAATYDGTDLLVYVNGVQDAITSPGTLPSTGTGNLSIGANAGASSFFAGQLDEVRIYNRALDASEIAALAQTDATPPSAPSNAGAVVNGQQVNLSWNAAVDAESGISAYRVYRGIASGPGKAFLAGVSGSELSYTDTATAPDTTYYYEVSAVNGGGVEGLTSSEVSATTGNDPPGAPTGLTAVAGNEQVSLNWNDNPEPDVAGYHVYRSAASGGPYTKISTNVVTESTFIDTGLTNGQAYYYVVTVQDTAGSESAHSAEASATPNAIDPTLVAHWAFEEGTGTIAADSSSQGNDGTLVNGPTWTTGQVGGALSFDGVNDYVETNYTSNLVEWTAATWVYSSAAPTNASPNGPVSRDQNFHIGWDHTNSAFRGAAAAKVGGSWYAATFGQLNPNTWYHLAATYDGENLKTYKDGLLVTDNAGPSGVPNSEGDSLKIGRHASAAHFFTGKIDEARVYNRALESGEIATLAGVDPGNEPLFAHAGPDQTVTDADGNGSEFITLNGSASTGFIVSYEWSEGTTQIATGVSPSVTLDIGTHTITLVVTDDTAATSTDEVGITVNAPNPSNPFDSSVFISGLESPTGMEFSPDGRLFIAEQNGTIKIVKDGAVLPNPFLTVPVNLTDPEQRGLIGLAFHPNFAATGHVYVYYTKVNTGQNRLSRYTVSATNPDVADPNSEVIILDDVPAAIWHNGGDMHFVDGYLFLATGDALDAANAQSLGSLAGKLLRIYPNGTIPPDNPFVGVPGAREEIWALGLRQPFKGAVDPATNTYYMNDVGEGAVEEINQVNMTVSGLNYGWPDCEGSCSNSAFENPVYSYSHSEGCAITGGIFYRMNQFPAEYTGNYFFTDYCSGWIRRLLPDSSVVNFVESAAFSVDDLKVGPDGSLYYLLFVQGEVRKITHVGSGNRTPTAVASADPETGLAPLQVSFDGSGSTDPDNDPLLYTWDFGDGSPTENGVSVIHTYSADGLYVAQLTVDDQNGATALDSTTVAVGNSPVGTITLPTQGTTFNAGDIVQYTGTATDVEDGSLPASAFSWKVVLHHHPENDPLHHVHPFVGPVIGVTNGSFAIPVEAHDHDIFFRIHLTVTDSDGLTHEITRDITPNLSELTFDTVPSGLNIKLDSQPKATPLVEESIVGSVHTIEAVSPQLFGGQGYSFQSWSDGGAGLHSISTPASNTAYVATYAADPTLAGYWAFDDGFGTSAIDSSPQGNHGTLLNDPMWTAGRIGGAISFDGLDDYVSLPDTPSLNVTGPMTIAFWVRTTSSKDANILGGYQSNSPWPGYGIHFGHPNNERVSFWSGAYGSWVSSNFGINDGNWHHVAVTVSGTTLAFYKDGVLEQTLVSSEPNSYAGVRAIAARSTGGSHFNGSIDELYIYNRELSATEIAALAD